MIYSEVQQIILKYAPEMAPHFADRFERFPRGGQAAMIVNYLNDKATFYYNLGIDDIAKQCVSAAGEIITREPTA